VAVSTGSPLPPVLGAPFRAVKKLGNTGVTFLDDLGAQLSFYGRSIFWSYRTLTRYKKEVIRLLAEVSLGSGALALVGGTIGVIAFLTFFTGTEVGLQGYAALNQLGTSNFTAFPRSCRPISTPERSPRWSPGWPCRPPSGAASPPSSGPCGSRRRSTPWR